MRRIKFLINIALSAFFIPLAHAEFTKQDSIAIEHKVDSIVGEMSLDELIGQLFMVYTESTWDKKNTDFFLNQMRMMAPGGIIIFRGNPTTAKGFIEKMQKNSKIPLWVGADAEYGLAMRLSEVERIPYAMQLGAIRDNRIIQEAGEIVGGQCKSIGVHFNFAPVLDLNNNSNNPVINYRSFGDNPNAVVNKAHAFSLGLEQHGIISVGKHFPGHGNTTADSHHQLPTVSGSYDELNSFELEPFKQIIRRGIPAIMVAHLNVPSLDSTGTPTSLSPIVIQDILRDSLQFKGLVISDALNMKAVSNGIEKPYLKALLAGNDILLMPENFEIAHNEIRDAFVGGELAGTYLRARCKNIIRQKLTLTPDLFNKKPVVALSDYSTKIKAINSKVNQQSICLLKNDADLLPIKNLESQKILLIENSDQPSAHYERLKFYANIERLSLKDIKNDTILVEKIIDKSLIIVTAHGNITQRSSKYGIPNKLFKTLDKVTRIRPTLLISLANPYALTHCNINTLKACKGLMIGYTDNKESQEVAAEIVFGGKPALGQLSVEIPNFAKSGEGLFTKQIRLGFAKPSDVGINESLNDSIRQYILKAISDKATPGAQILVAKDNNIILNHSYGYHTYSKKRKVNDDDIYDIASLTKIVSTMPLVMKLNEEGRMQEDDKVSKYLDRLNNTDKADITVKDLLRHTSGLPSYIPFQYRLLDVEKLGDKPLFNRKYSNTYSIKLDDYAYINRNAKYYKGFFSKEKDKVHPTEVASKLYVHHSFPDTMRTRLDKTELKNSGEYNYSDLGYLYMYDIFKNTMHLNIDRTTKNKYYEPLGMYHTTYLPLSNTPKEKIIPTEKDNFFRHQLVKGNVHDQTAALLGGVACHSGLFSNASDLAKLMQLFLNKGMYGDERYLASETINHFTQNTDGDGRRAIGFDKPETDSTKVNPTCDSASLESFGHSGFTGTYVWTDPKYNLIYVFLSNRIHPNSYNRKLVKDNVRTKIQQSIYNCLIQD